ncbi:hypothetical protein N7481_010368 [Penicillium waksmanii]|uniref:uncharacterized protein n=1 Tax=Penicillium waksmanii TaxID=69791 RepID=UPI002546BA49|nr:uncharacterized protein N7481_010368 [Penicillium waksmanii]KAJ5973158.1 hypothetical protein N7481_010368 [Penicillium waksmanii]
MSIYFWGFDGLLSSSADDDERALHSDSKGPDFNRPKQRFPVIHPGDQRFTLRMQETTKKDDFWGFDPDLSCLSPCAKQDGDNNSHQIGFPKL